MIAVHRRATRVTIGAIALVLVAMTIGDPTWAKKSGPTLPFGTDVEEALELGRAEGKPVVVSFVAAWCPLCTQMKSSTYRDPALLGLADDFIWVLVDIDRQLSVAREHDVTGVPLVKVLDAKGESRGEMLGLWTAEAMVNRLQAVRDGQPIGLQTTEAARSELTWKPKGYRGTGICFSHVGYGPVSTYAQSAFQSLRLGIRPRTPSTLGKGQYEARVTTTLSNFWAVDGDVNDPDKRYFLDFESLQAAVSIAYGVTDHLEVELELQDRSRFGGVLDPITEASHNTFGFDANGRDEVPSNQFVFDLTPPNGPPVSLTSSDRGTFSRTAQLTVQHNVTCGTAKRPAFSYAVSARVETVDAGDLSGGGDLDLGASVALSQRFGKFYIYGTIGYAWFSKDNFRGIPLIDTQLTLLAAGEWRFKPKMSLTLQWMSTEGLIEGFDPFSDNSDELVLGYKWEVRDRGTLEFGFVENLVSFDNTPDVGFHAGFAQRF